MRRMNISILLTVLLVMSSTAKGQQIDTLVGQLRGLASDIRTVMETDTKLQGQKLLFGKVVATDLPDSSYELRLEAELKVLLEGILGSKSRFTLSFSYDYLPSASENNQGNKVVQISYVIKDDKRKALSTGAREINDTGDIAKILGQILVPPDVQDFRERNRAANDAQENPQFHLLEKTRVTAVGKERYAVELRKRRGGHGELQAIAPSNENGKPYAAIDVGDTYEVVLYNYDEQSDAVVELTIDGLDAANTFNADGVKYPGYFVPRAKNGMPGVHVVPGWLHTVKKADDNVFQFVVNELGKGAASSKKVRSGIGIVTAAFKDACEPHENLRKRNFGETGKGAGMRVDYQLKQVKIGTDPIAIISIRYTRTPQ